MKRWLCHLAAAGRLLASIIAGLEGDDWTAGDP